MRQDVYGIKNLCNYKTNMFPYNDEENAWISQNVLPKAKLINHNLIYSIIFALFTALLSSTIPAIIYFSRIYLI